MELEESDRQNHSDWRGIACYLGPLAVFFLVAEAYPTISRLYLGETPDGTSSQLTLALVASRFCLMMLAISFGLSRVRRQFPIRVSHWGITFGIVGAILWIGICSFDLESRLLVVLGLSPSTLGERLAINPFEMFPETTSFWTFLIFRFGLLVVAVPIAEEFMLRGFLIRAIEHADWENLSLEKVGRNGMLCATAYGMLSHPSEWIAAMVWFSLITLLMLKSRNLWDCILAHAITNALLGGYIMVSGDWRLW